MITKYSGYFAQSCPLIYEKLKQFNKKCKHMFQTTKSRGCSYFTLLIFSFKILGKKKISRFFSFAFNTRFEFVCFCLVLELGTCLCWMALLRSLSTTGSGGLVIHCRTAKTKCQKLKLWNWKIETNIPRKGILGYESQFPHSCVCERIIYSHDGSAFSAGGNMWTDPGNI